MTTVTRRTGNEGSAFVISILVLFVLSVLGLALMLTTTTEKEIAINYRFGEQAFFNADAALECVKVFEDAACVIVKHANPCGVAEAAAIGSAYDLASAADTTSAGISCAILMSESSSIRPLRRSIR